MLSESCLTPLCAETIFRITDTIIVFLNTAQGTCTHSLACEEWVVLLILIGNEIIILFKSRLLVVLYYVLEVFCSVFEWVNLGGSHYSQDTPILGFLDPCVDLIFS